MTEETTILDLDSLLDTSLDNIEDVPDYVDPPSGNYVLAIENAEAKPNKDKTKPASIRITYRVVNTKELAFPEKDMPVADGSLFSENFQVTEQGLGYFKQRARQVMEVSDVNGVALRDLLAAVKDAKEFNGAISHTESKGKNAAGEEVTYKNMRLRVSHDAPAA